MDGTPIGFAFRDPVRRAKVEFHVRGDDLFVVADGKAEQGWSIVARADTELDESTFRRPR